MNITWWVFLLIFLIFIGIVASIIYFFFVKTSTSSQAWMYWGIGFSVYVLFCAAILCGAYTQVDKKPNLIEMEKLEFQQLAQQAKNDPMCMTARSMCYKERIDQKRDNDLQRPNLDVLTEELQQNPLNNELAQTVRIVRAEVENDLKLIDECKYEPASNPCVENVIDKCQNMINATNDRILQTQFRDFRAQREPSEVLTFCNAASNTIH